MSDKKCYSIHEMALLLGKSDNLIYRRLTEKPQKYVVRYARKEGDRWVFDKSLVDDAIRKSESIIRRIKDTVLSDERFFSIFNRESRSCGRIKP
jgi:hypothetical protein